MMRVLHVYSGNLYGGVETMLGTLAREGHRCPEMEAQFALCFPGRLADELSRAGAAVHSLGAVRLRQPRTVFGSRKALDALLRRVSFDIVVCHSAWPLAVFGPVVRAHGVPLVSWLHDAPARGHWLDALARRTAVREVICNSRFTADAHRAVRQGVPLRVLHCPVSTPDDHSAERAAIREALDTPASAVVIVQASRVTPWKGHEVLFDALARLREVPGWIHWQIGGVQGKREHAYGARLRALAAETGIADRVRFLGQRSDVARLLAAADVHCQPNTGPEPFGVAFVEALAAGRPVVATAIGGACEILDASCGVLVPPKDPAALAEALARLVGDPALRARLGAAGPGRARVLCDPGARIADLHDILSGILSRETAALPASSAGGGR